VPRHTASARPSLRLTRLTALDDRRCIVSRPRHSHRGATMSAVKDEIARALDRAGDELEQLSRKIHDHPELGYQEVKASAWLAEFLGARGFKVERGIAGVDTAFRATLDTGDGPTVAIMCEYDALPGIGHACGHNVIAAAGAGAGVGLAAVREKLPKGRIHVIGTPAEEGGGGKGVRSAGATASSPTAAPRRTSFPSSPPPRSTCGRPGSTRCGRSTRGSSPVPRAPPVPRDAR